tara:strand:+ start:4381 stop:8826 length:4446 start_codon:yes stop_codon:yes gene_type:complete
LSEDLIINNGSTVYLYGTHYYDDIILTNGSVIRPPGNSNETETLTLICDSLYIEYGSKITAAGDASGTSDLATPAQMTGGGINGSGGGGGFGGRGGNGGGGNPGYGGETYGDFDELLAGSCGAGGYAGDGGGGIHIIANSAIIEGSIHAFGGSGGSCLSDAGHGGGSGGMIWLEIPNLELGNLCEIKADGGPGGTNCYNNSNCMCGGGGGGGRITLMTLSSIDEGLLNVDGGLGGSEGSSGNLGFNGEDGVITYYQLTPGCTNPEAENYNPDAEYDDGSCFFGTMEDSDGNIYEVVVIGDQTWMKENLKTTKYRNGGSIYTSDYSNDEWANLTYGAYTVYENDDSNIETYGLLYNWHTIRYGNSNPNEGICPVNWHVPSDEEWQELSDYLGGNNVSSGKLKEVGTEHWNSPNEGATNESYFTALAGGERTSSGNWNNSMGDGAYFWTSDSLNANQSYARNIRLIANNPITFFNDEQKVNGQSVRCIKDEVIQGCTNFEACNYNPDANVDDGSCLYFDECGECGGSGAIYECGCEDEQLHCRDLDGDGWGTSEFTFETCDVEGDIWVTNCEDLDDSIYCESNETDCAGILCGDTVVDECGTCDGNGIQDYYADWDGDGYGDCDSVYPFCPNDAESWASDVCGDCDNSDADVIFNDCAGVCGGSSELDECGDCNGSNDCFPVAIDGQYTLDEDNQINIYLSATDSDGDALTFSIVNQPSNGTLTLEGVSATYSPNANYNGNDSFTFMANDGQFDSNQATISLTVMSVNDAPYLLDIPDADVESSSVFTYELQAVDVDGDDLAYTVTSSGSATATLSGNMLTVTPEYGNNGVTIIAVTVSDGVSTDTEEFSLTIFTYGCTGFDSCNYNPDANVDDGSCIYAQENYDCDGNCLLELDLCDNCGGDNFNSEGYHCGDLQVLQDFIDLNEDLSGQNPLEIGIYQTWEEGKLIAINLTRPSSSYPLISIIPESINNLTELNILGLQNNEITDIPESIGNLNNLLQLDFGSNLLTSIPNSLGNLTNLEVLNLSYNLLLEIPESVWNLSIHQQFNVNNNLLTYLPTSDNVCPTEDDYGMTVYGNRLCEEYHYECISNMYWDANGEHPQDQSNCCEGPNSEENWTNCTDEDGNCLLELDLCGICGGDNSTCLDDCNVPNGPGYDCGGACFENVELWGQCYNIQTTTILDLSNNQLTGEIPPEIGNLINLTSLKLGYNQLSGDIPIEIWSLINLNYLSLTDNQLSGTIPSQIGNLVNLTALFLNMNQLTGEIPPEIGNLININSYLSLSENELSGEIPGEIGNLISLVELNLFDNQFSGSIPSEIGNLNNLNFLYIQDNQLSGYIPNQITNLTSLIDLNLRFNQLTGEIPVEIGNMVNLNNLYLNNNLLIGEIPVEICNIADNTPDVGYNKLCPLYPSCISQEDIDSQDTSNCDESLLGDLNSDGTINVVDIVMLVNIILNGEEYNSVGDLNSDGTINVVDIVSLVSLILNP